MRHTKIRNIGEIGTVPVATVAVHFGRDILLLRKVIAPIIYKMPHQVKEIQCQNSKSLHFVYNFVPRGAFFTLFSLYF